MKSVSTIAKILGILFVILLLGIAGSFYWLNHQITSLSNSPIAEISPTSTGTQQKDAVFSFKNKTYAYAFFTVSNYTTISLIPNFTEQKSAQVLTDTNACISGINAGFYSKEKTPLGLWNNGTDEKGQALTSLLFNGYYWIDAKSAYITNTKPTAYRIAVQTGPLVLFDTKPLPLVIKNDEYARRMVAGVDEKGQTMFLTVFDPDSVYSGPLLAELPEVLQEIEPNLPFLLLHAVNLDGGSASAFISPNRTLSELTPVGSMFCIK